MKKICLFIAATVLSTALFSQGNLKSQFYFRYGASIPSWDYYGSDGNSDLFEDATRYGAVFELGSIFMINKLRLVDGMRLGINVDYLSITFHGFKNDVTHASLSNFFLGSKVGLSVSYSPVKKLVFDTYVKISPVWFAGTIIDYGNNDYDHGFEEYLGLFGSKYSVGLNIRLAFFMIGAEVNPGLTSLKRTITDNIMEDAYEDNPFDDGDLRNMLGYNITIGFSF